MEVPDGKLLDLDSITSSQLAKHVRYVMCSIVCVCVCTLCVNVCVCILCVRTYICTCTCTCMCVHVCVYACVCTCITHVYILSQLTVVELSLFKAVDLYEMTVHLWEGNTPGRTC